MPSSENGLIAPVRPAVGERPSDKQILHELFHAALNAATPEGKFGGILPHPPKGRTIVIGAGKAAASMARAFEDAWGRPCEGLVVTRYGHSAPTRHVEVVEAGHPVPDDAGMAGAQRVFQLASSAGADDLVVCMMSGGASALLTMPYPGISLSDKQAITSALLRCGAPISAINTVRRSLSAIKGGRLGAAAMPAKIVTYLISDVPGDAPATIGSGPTILTPSTPDAALSILDEYEIAVPESVRSAILRNRVPDSTLGSGEIHTIATPRMALEAAAAKARAMGIEPIILGDAIEGEARELGIAFAGIVRSVLTHADPVRKPCVLLSSGETTVTLRGRGRGGRNTEFLLSLRHQLRNTPGFAAIACDTDGIDGSEDNAGAWIGDIMPDDPLDLTRSYLNSNDAYSYFERIGRLVVTGPTLTNVNDFRALLVR
ncbi:glycerate kinase type-2 family protein [Paradevosia shaoguanensis]|uniref:glycerate kinase type-2 family protein n=1 Tax=Paradevosia shaoguanensis TaxID=1335043 RepID=UPI000A68E5A3